MDCLQPYWPTRDSTGRAGLGVPVNCGSVALQSKTDNAVLKRIDGPTIFRQHL